MRSKFNLSLAIIACILSFASSRVNAQAVNQPYWHEGFNNSTGKLNSSSTDPSMGVESSTTASGAYVTWQVADSGVWAFYGAYRSTGSACATINSVAAGPGHIRMSKYSDGTTIPYFVTPIVSEGIGQVYFAPTTSGKRFSIQWTLDTSAAAAHWTYVTGMDSTGVSTTCIDTAINVNEATAKRIRFLDIFPSSAGYQADIDSVILTSYFTITTPVTFISVNASLAGGTTKVSWVVGNPVNVKGYVVERSTDGKTFYPIGSELSPTASDDYSAFDESPAAGINYYRIEEIDINGNASYSSIVVVNAGSNADAKLLVTPNPVVNKQVNVQVSGFTAGTYTLGLYGSNGQSVYSTPVTLYSGSTVLTFNAPSAVAGIYQLVLANGASKTSTTVLVK